MRSQESWVDPPRVHLRQRGTPRRSAPPLVVERPAPRRDARPRQAATLMLHVTPNRSVSMPKPGLQAEAARGSTVVAPSARPSQ